MTLWKRKNKKIVLRDFWEVMAEWRKGVTPTQSAIRDALLHKRNAKREYRWIKRVNRGFWILEHIYPYNSRPIEVTDWTDFVPRPEHQWNGRPGYLDIEVRIPYVGMRHLPHVGMRWIFTVENLESFSLYKNVEDAHTDVWWNYGRGTDKDKEYLLTDLQPVNFWTKLTPQLPALLMNPIVEYDRIWTNAEDFGREDVVKYARIWFEKFYPNLAKREIIFVNPS